MHHSVGTVPVTENDLFVCLFFTVVAKNLMSIGGRRMDGSTATGGAYLGSTGPLADSWDRLISLAASVYPITRKTFRNLVGGWDTYASFDASNPGPDISHRVLRNWGVFGLVLQFTACLSLTQCLLTRVALTRIEQYIRQALRTTMSKTTQHLVQRKGASVKGGWVYDSSAAASALIFDSAFIRLM
jgi:hypothetical protein